MNNLTFDCISGKSSQPVNLRLSLHRQDGSVIELGKQNVTTRQITTEDNKALFLCHMTSDQFPTVYRNCTAGPITVLKP